MTTPKVGEGGSQIPERLPVSKMKELFEGLDKTKKETAKKAARLSVEKLPTKEAPPKPQQEVHAKAGKPIKEGKMPPPILHPKPKMPAAETPQKPAIAPKPTVPQKPAIAPKPTVAGTPQKPAIASKPKTEAAPQQIRGKVPGDIVEKSKLNIPASAPYWHFVDKYNKEIEPLPSEVKAVIGSNVREFLTKNLVKYFDTLGLNKLLGLNIVDIDNALWEAGFDDKQLYEILYGDQKDSDQYSRLGEALAETLVNTQLEAADNKAEAKLLLKEFVSKMEGDRLNDSMKSALLKNGSSAQWKKTTKPLADGFMTHLRSRV